MDQREFEQRVLQMVHHRGLDRVTPSAMAYEFGASVKDAERMLDRMVTTGALELDSDDDGNLFYFVPGLGTAGVFTHGTSAAHPAEPPQPPPQSAPQPYPQSSPNAPNAGAQGWGGAATGYGAPPQSTPASPYGGSPGPYGQAPPQGGYGAPPQPPPQHGAPNPYGAPYGQTAASAAPNAAPGYGQAPSYGQAPGYGGQPPGAYGNPGAPPYGPPPGSHGSSVYPGQPGPYGGQPSPYTYGQNALVHTNSVARSPLVASMLSAFFPGAGQLYNGQVGKGLFFFFSTVFLFTNPAFMLVPYFWSVVDSYSTRRRMNDEAYAQNMLPYQP